MKNRFTTYFILLLAAQILLCNFLNISPYLMLSILPVLILAIPSSIPTVGAMLIAFATGLAVDFLSEGVIGLNAASLLPVAYVRRDLSALIFGEKFNDTSEPFSVKNNGVWKMIFAILVSQTIFLLVYFWAEGAFMTRTLGFNLLRFGVSLSAGVLLSVLIAETCASQSDDIKSW
jgi:hypothetical protein